MAHSEQGDGILEKLGDFTTDRRVFVPMAMGLVAGTGGVAAGWVLLRLIALVNDVSYYGIWSTRLLPPGGAYPPHGHPALWTILIPVLGALIIGLMAKYGTEKIRGHGIPEALEAIMLGGSRLDVKTAILKPLSSAISIGTGGPFGAEGPIIMTGGAIGSLFAQFFEITDMERKTLLVAGACAGMTAVFGTPIAAMLLAVELLLFELKPRSLLPVAIACVTAAIERRYLLMPAPIFPYLGGAVISPVHALGWVGLGLLAGLGSALLTQMVYAAEDGFLKLPVHWMWWPMLGAVVVGIGGVFDPRALGVGYPDIAQMLAGHLAGMSALRLMLVKGIIWAVALGSGTSGGVLAPLLIIGGGLGAVLAPFLPAAAPGFWAVLGMASMMGGTMRAPFTATLFAVELTGNHAILLPVITACMASYTVTVLLMKRSILTEKLARRGHHLSREYIVDPMALVRARDIMTAPVETLAETMSIGGAIAYFLDQEHRHRAYPVVDARGGLVGLVSRADVLAWIGAETPRERLLRDALRDRPVVTAAPGEMAGTIATKMLTEDAARIPVVDPRDGRLLGIISRADLMKIRDRELRAETTRRAYFLRGERRRAITGPERTESASDRTQKFHAGG
ncbi:MAG TPA: chloride channel protein [Acetobacteraceae bacterium]|nr:chloride channel protein [Acetobacteraceae bacterium]